MSEITFKSIFMRANPTIKESSLRTYVNAMNGLQKKILSEDINPLISELNGSALKNNVMGTTRVSDYANMIYKGDWIHDSTLVIDTINNNPKNTPNTKRTLYGYLKIMLKGVSNDAMSLEEYNLYHNQEAIFRKEVADIREKNREKTGMPVTDKQAENIISKEELMNFLRALTLEIKQQDKDLKKLQLTDTTAVPDYFDAQNDILYILLNTHLRLPIRNELHQLVLGKKNKMNDLTKNYLYKDGKDWFIVRNVYKTADSQVSGGQKIDKLQPELAKMYNKYVKKYNLKEGNLIFQTINTSQKYSSLLSEFFYKRSGKKISSTMLTKIINELREEDKEFINMIKALSKKRGTNIGDLLTYYL